MFLRPNKRFVNLFCTYSSSAMPWKWTVAKIQVAYSSKLRPYIRYKRVFKILGKYVWMYKMWTVHMDSCMLDGMCLYIAITPYHEHIEHFNYIHLKRFVHRALFSCGCRQHLRTLVGGHSATLRQRFGTPFHMNCGRHHASERFGAV